MTPRKIGSRVHLPFLPHGTIVRVIDPTTKNWIPHENMLPIDKWYYLVQPDKVDLKPHIVRHDELNVKPGLPAWMT